MTDNKNRTVGELRHALDRKGGKLGSSGSVAHLFETKGYIVIEGAGLDEDTVMTAALEAGAEDVETSDGLFEVYTAPGELHTVAEVLQAAGFPYTNAEVARIPSMTVELTGKSAQSMLNLLDALEDLDDVQKVYANFEMSDEEMAKAES